MKFDQTFVLDAPRDKVRAFLEDVPTVARCVPGVEDVQAVGPDEYDGRVRLRIGPLGLSIAGRAHLERQDDVWRLRGEGRDGRVGTGVKALLEALLIEAGPQSTEVRLTADVQFSGRLAELGQPLIRHKASSLVNEFVQNLRQAFAAA